MSGRLAMIVLSVRIVNFHNIVTEPISVTGFFCGVGVCPINFLQFPSHRPCIFTNANIVSPCQTEFYIRWVSIACNLIQNEQVLLLIHHKISIWSQHKSSVSLTIWSSQILVLSSKTKTFSFSLSPCTTQPMMDRWLVYISFFWHVPSIDLEDVYLPDISGFEPLQLSIVCFGFFATAVDGLWLTCSSLSNWNSLLH